MVEEGEEKNHLPHKYVMLTWEHDTEYFQIKIFRFFYSTLRTSKVLKAINPVICAETIFLFCFGYRIIEKGVTIQSMVFYEKIQRNWKYL